MKTSVSVIGDGGGGGGGDEEGMMWLASVLFLPKARRMDIEVMIRTNVLCSYSYSDFIKQNNCYAIGRYTFFFFFL